MANGDHKWERIAGQAIPASGSATEICRFTLAANQSARCNGRVQVQPSQNVQDGGHYSADFDFSVRYSGGTLNTTASWTARNVHGSLGAGITLNFADGGSGVVRIEASSAQDYRCSVSADVEIIEQTRT